MPLSVLAIEHLKLGNGLEDLNLVVDHLAQRVAEEIERLQVRALISQLLDLFEARYIVVRQLQHLKAGAPLSNELEASRHLVVL